MYTKVNQYIISWVNTNQMIRSSNKNNKDKHINNNKIKYFKILTDFGNIII